MFCIAWKQIYLKIYDGKTDIDYVHYFNVSFLGKWPLKMTSRKISSEKWGIHFSFLYSNFLVYPQEVEHNKNSEFLEDAVVYDQKQEFTCKHCLGA